MVNQPLHDFHMAESAGVVQSRGVVFVGQGGIDGFSRQNARQQGQQALLVEPFNSCGVALAAQFLNQLSQTIVRFVGGQGDAAVSFRSGSQAKGCPTDEKR